MEALLWIIWIGTMGTPSDGWRIPVVTGIGVILPLFENFLSNQQAEFMPFL